MNINGGAWHIRKTHQIETELEEDLLCKIEHMENQLEELQEDLDREKQRYYDMDDDWATRFSEMKEELQARITELEDDLDECQTMSGG